MADDTSTVVPNDPAITPEPVPDNIADTDLTALNPASESTDSEQVEDSQDETQQDQPEAKEEEAPEPETEAKPDTTSEEEPEQPEQTEENPEEDSEAARKRHNDEMARQRIEQRNYINEQRAQIREAEASADPNDQARRLEILEAKQYVDTIERNRSSLVNDNTQAQATIDLFNPNNPSYNEKLYTRAIQRFNDNYVITDPDTGEVLGAQDRQGNNVSLYQYLQQEAADMSEILGNTQATTQRTAQQAEAKMRAKAVNPSNPGKVMSSGDELADLLDKVGDIPLV